MKIRTNLFFLGPKKFKLLKSKLKKVLIELILLLVLAIKYGEIFFKKTFDF